MQCHAQNPKPNPNSMKKRPLQKQRSMPPSSSGNVAARLQLLLLIIFLLLPFSIAQQPQEETDTDVVDNTDLLSSCETLTTKKTVINYLALHTCVFRGVHVITIPVLLALVILAFYILAKAAQDHFSPVVAKMADLLHLSPSTGGVTLLALGNGAPDVFSSVAAVWGGNPRIGLGAIVSAGLFVSAFVVGFVALSASPFPLNPIPFVRDVCFYFVSAVLMFLLYLSGEVHVWQAAGLVSIYILFVVLVFAMDRGKNKTLNTVSELNSDERYGELDNDDGPVQDYDDAQVPCYGNRSSSGSRGFVHDDENARPMSLDVEIGNSRSKLIKANSKIVKANGVGAAEATWKAYEDRQPRDLRRVFSTLACSLLCCGNTDSGKFNQILKVQLIWQVPVEFVLRCTIPAVNPSQWNRFYASANLVCCPLIFLYILSSAISPYRKMVFIIPWIDFPLWLLILLQGTILAVTYYMVTKEPPKDELPIAVVTAFIMSVFWISFIAGELVGCLATLGMLLKLPPALLGLTVLAWGNSVGDLVADVAVAKAGQPAMAMAGCFAGPMFNMLVGFGLALAMKASRMQPAPYVLEYNPSIVVAFFFLFVSLLGSLTVIMWSKFQVPRFWGFCLIGLYITFVVVSISNASTL